MVTRSPSSTCEPHEYEVANIGARLIPLGELPERLVEIDRDETIAVHCKTGGRSARAVKLILGIGEPLIGRLLLYDALGMRFREMRLRKDPNCPVCGENPTVTELIDYQEFCGIPQANAKARADEVPEITVQELKERMHNGGKFSVLDVREPHEYEVANIGARLIPLAELPERLIELDRDETLAVHCKTGGRSARAVRLLQDSGFQNVYNVRGGIDAWSEEIDSSVPRY